MCGNLEMRFLMHNKLVCPRCDELLFDLEIELDEPEKEICKNTASPPQKVPAEKRKG
jgi:hypothetical protein